MKPAFLLFGCLLLISCSQNRPEQGGFYSWVDAQGNMVTVPRDSAEEETDPAETEPGTPAEEQAVPDTALDDDIYRTDEEVQALIEQRERDRFVVYQDASGYQVVQPIDVPAARQAREEMRGAQSEALDTNRVFIERVEGVPANCCLPLLEDAEALSVGQELLINFSRPPYAWATMPASHPARAVKLDSAVATVRIRTFLLKSGYLHPQALFLDSDGIPVLLVDNLFFRRYPETWYRYAALEGEVPVPERAVSMVLYLSYAQPGDAGSLALRAGQYPWQEQGQVLSVNGELLIRGLASGQ